LVFQIQHTLITILVADFAAAHECFIHVCYIYYNEYESKFDAWSWNLNFSCVIAWNLEKCCVIVWNVKYTLYVTC